MKYNIPRKFLAANYAPPARKRVPVDADYDEQLEAGNVSADDLLDEDNPVTHRNKDGSTSRTGFDELGAWLAGRRKKGK